MLHQENTWKSRLRILVSSILPHDQQELGVHYHERAGLRHLEWDGFRQEAMVTSLHKDCYV
jgi:hypothetical protein